MRSASRNAIGVGVSAGKPLIARTPLAFRLNVSLHTVRGIHTSLAIAAVHPTRQPDQRLIGLLFFGQVIANG